MRLFTYLFWVIFFLGSVVQVPLTNAEKLNLQNAALRLHWITLESSNFSRLNGHAGSKTVFEITNESQTIIEYAVIFVSFIDAGDKITEQERLQFNFLY